jgi:hypothetical protein
MKPNTANPGALAAFFDTQRTEKDAIAELHKLLQRFAVEYGLKPAQAGALAALLTTKGNDPVRAAKRCGATRWTIRRWQTQDRNFMRAMDAAKLGLAQALAVIDGDDPLEVAGLDTSAMREALTAATTTTEGNAQ